MYCIACVQYSRCEQDGSSGRACSVRACCRSTGRSLRPCMLTHRCLVRWTRHGMAGATHVSKWMDGISQRFTRCILHVPELISTRNSARLNVVSPVPPASPGAAFVWSSSSPLHRQPSKKQVSCGVLCTLSRSADGSPAQWPSQRTTPTTTRTRRVRRMAEMRRLLERFWDWKACRWQRSWI